MENRKQGQINTFAFYVLSCVMKTGINVDDVRLILLQREFNFIFTKLSRVLKEMCFH